MTETLASEEFEEWAESLSESERVAVIRYIDLLEQFGVGLGHPYTSAIKDSKIALRELRVKAGKAAIRVFYVFDPERRAVLLIGGDKSGSGDKKFYSKMIAQAESIWAAYMKEGES